MKIRTITISALVAIAAFVAQLPGDASARVGEQRGRRKRVYAARKAPGQFNVSGRYTGLLSGTVRISRREVNITADTKFYVVGKGLQNDAPMLTGHAIYVQGMRDSNGSNVAVFVIVQSL